MQHESSEAKNQKTNKKKEEKKHKNEKKMGTRFSFDALSVLRCLILY